MTRQCGWSVLLKGNYGTASLLQYLVSILYGSTWVTSASTQGEALSTARQRALAMVSVGSWCYVSPGLRESLSLLSPWWSHAYIWQLLKWTVLSTAVCSPQQGEWAAFTLSCSFGLILNICGSKTVTRKAKFFVCFLFASKFTSIL